MNATVESLTREESYTAIDPYYDAENKAAWCIWNGHGGSCFTAERLQEIRRFQSSVDRQVRADLEAGCEPGIQYVVFASSVPGVYSFGGDLAFFVDVIRQGDRLSLEAYMELCFESLAWIACQDLPIRTVALVQGTALGAGFETALACDTLLLEEQAELGFPEALFNMFPGMGGYSFLSRHLGPRAAERTLLSARTYGARELLDIGLADVVADKDEGHQAFAHYLRKQTRFGNVKRALIDARRRVNPVTREELRDIAGIWVDAALRLSERDLKTMERLVRAQKGRSGGATSTPAESRMVDAS